jgi:glycosyltransferase involved in cell wall biosynthesis
MRPRRLALVHTWHPPGIGSVDALLAADPTRRELARALAARGHHVTVVQEAPFDAEADDHGVRWVLHRPSRATRLARRGLAAAGDPHPIVRAPSDAPLRHVEAARPDLVHSFDLAFYPSLALLGRLAKRIGAPLVAHFHGGAPARRPLLRVAQSLALARLDGMLFNDPARAAAWPFRGPVFDVLETSTPLRFTDTRDAARALVRARWGLRGAPLFLCPGRLDPVKDPLTVLRGFARYLSQGHVDDAVLAMAYTDAPLLDACRHEVRRLGLGERVAFLGRVPHAEMPALLAAADALVQASTREVAGVAVLEAAAVGCPPVLSDLPVFRRNLGAHGGFFPVGDADALARALREATRTAEPARAALRAHFEAELSFEAMARQVEAAHTSVLTSTHR